LQKYVTQHTWSLWFMFLATGDVDKVPTRESLAVKQLRVGALHEEGAQGTGGLTAVIILGTVVHVLHEGARVVLAERLYLIWN